MQGIDKDLENDLEEFGMEGGEKAFENKSGLSDF